MKPKIKVTVLITKDNKILLIKEWSNKRNGYFWNLIKGTFGDHPNETLEACAKRESIEEAGVEVEVENLSSCYVSASEDFGIQFNFIAHSLSQKPSKITNKTDQQKRGEDIIETKWLTKEEVLKLPAQEFINNRIHKAIDDWSKNKKYSLEVISEWN